jgi:hypothetical protein
MDVDESSTARSILLLKVEIACKASDAIVLDAFLSSLRITLVPIYGGRDLRTFGITRIVRNLVRITSST